MGINGAAYEQLFGAAIFHDIGAIGLAERLALLDFEETDAHAHGKLGALLLERFPGFKAYAPLVKFHMFIGIRARAPCTRARKFRS